MTYAPHRAAPTRKAPPDDPMDSDPLRWRARLWIVGGAVTSAALVVFGAWAVATTPPAETVATAAPDGSPVNDFGFDVTGLRCGVSSVGPSGLEQRAAGQFCLLDVKVTNNGREPVLFDSGAQRVHDTDGKSYAVAEQAAVFLNDRSPTLLNEIQPGETVTGVLPFDVPTDVRPSDAVLREGKSTEGVRVTLPDPR